MIGKREAVLFDESGREIWRGYPADMPIRFYDTEAEHPDDTIVETTMGKLNNSGTPVSNDTGDYLSLFEFADVDSYMSPDNPARNIVGFG